MQLCSRIGPLPYTGTMTNRSKTESVEYMLNSRGSIPDRQTAKQSGRFPHPAWCTIFAAGQYYDEFPYTDKSSLIIAADGGLDYASSLGLTPDVFIGDNDSQMDLASRKELSDQTTVIPLPAQKDDTDLMAAAKYGWSQGIRQFDIYGALGKQIDHTLSSIMLLARLAQAGGIGFLHGDHTIVTAICNATMTFPEGYVAPRRMISIFAQSDTCTDVTIKGLAYELSHETVTNHSDFGSRNEFRNNTASSIHVGSGTLIITYPSEAPYPTIVTRVKPLPSLGDLSRTVSQHLAATDKD
ncbi:thiamin pyrophosphokinase [Scardovia inopinata]|uniref:Thiamine diphosphokinase n=2 Tax=Scardovia inopinata TaxID=78259 RepID=W1MXG3_SCAIO|nr:thiamine pyrophosphokinase [Scardovia inopinata F0304]SUV50977.1 thiamin pyrophosphokinase [Scardovia inopinata]